MCKAGQLTNILFSISTLPSSDNENIMTSIFGPHSFFFVINPFLYIGPSPKAEAQPPFSSAKTTERDPFVTTAM